MALSCEWWDYLSQRLYFLSFKTFSPHPPSFLTSSPLFFTYHLAQRLGESLYLMQLLPDHGRQFLDLLLLPSHLLVCKFKSK